MRVYLEVKPIELNDTQGEVCIGVQQSHPKLSWE